LSLGAAIAGPPRLRPLRIMHARAEAFLAAKLVDPLVRAPSGGTAAAARV